MKKALTFVLFLGLLIVSLAKTKKPSTLAHRINTVFRMFSVSKFVDNYTPSKYAKNILDEKQEVSTLSVKVQLCRECVSAVLDHLGFKEDTIAKVNTAKVSMIMDSMDLFVAIAKGAKQGADLSKLRTTIPDLCDEATMTANVGNTANVKDAVDFIKDTIHPGSIQNMLRKEEIINNDPKLTGESGVVNKTSKGSDAPVEQPVVSAQTQEKPQQPQEKPQTQQEPQQQPQQTTKVSSDKNNKSSTPSKSKPDSRLKLNEKSTVKLGEKAGEFLEEKSSSNSNTSDTKGFKLVSMPESNLNSQSLRKSNSSTSSSMSVPTRTNPRFMTDEELQVMYKAHPELDINSASPKDSQSLSPPGLNFVMPNGDIVPRMSNEQSELKFMELKSKKVITEDELDN